MSKTFVCSHCEKVYLTWKKFYRHQYYLKSKKKQPLRKCAVCGKKYRGLGLKYCSYKCLGRDFSKRCSGKNHPSWGKREAEGNKIKCHGYIHIRNTKHPNAINGYVTEHKLVMEKYLGRYLKRSEKVHHRNQNREDNRLNNLELIITKGTHSGEVKCPFCLKKFRIP